jgi:predicted transcriptional regulator
MPTAYKIRPFTDTETDVWGAIAAITACDAIATPDEIQQFTGRTRTAVAAALRSLKTCGLIVATKESEQK